MSVASSAESTGESLAAKLCAARRVLAAQWLEQLNELLPVDKKDVFPGPQLLDHIPQISACAPGEASQPSIVVQDNGIGIPQGKVAAIFKEFVRAHAERDEELGAQGLGLGLAIVRECMIAMKGSVAVEATEGEGASFTLTWPT
jgi:signal transduction histidine kinase